MDILLLVSKYIFLSPTPSSCPSLADRISHLLQEYGVDYVTMNMQTLYV